MQTLASLFTSPYTPVKTELEGLYSLTLGTSFLTYSSFLKTATLITGCKVALFPATDDKNDFLRQVAVQHLKEGLRNTLPSALALHLFYNVLALHFPKT